MSAKIPSMARGQRFHIVFGDYSIVVLKVLRKDRD
jgi:hypothetical protein